MNMSMIDTYQNNLERRNRIYNKVCTMSIQGSLYARLKTVNICAQLNIHVSVLRIRHTISRFVSTKKSLYKSIKSLYACTDYQNGRNPCTVGRYAIGMLDIKNQWNVLFNHFIIWVCSLYLLIRMIHIRERILFICCFPGNYQLLIETPPMLQVQGYLAVFWIHHQA